MATLDLRSTAGTLRLSPNGGSATIRPTAGAGPAGAVGPQGPPGVVDPAAVSSAVTAQLAGQDIVVGTDQRVRHTATFDALLLPDADSNGRVAGGYDPVDGARVNLAGTKTPYAGTFTTLPGHGLAWIDKNGRISEFDIGEDGRFTDWVVQSLQSRMGAQASKLAPYVLTYGGGTTEVVPDGTARFPIKVPAQTRRWRLHQRNYEDISDTAYPGAVTMRGAWLGANSRAADGSLSGLWTTPPALALSGWTTDAAGAEYVSPWVTDSALQLTPNADLMLAVGWTNAAGQTNYRANGGCWRSTVSADAELVTPSVAPTRSTNAPFDFWIECEIASSVPVLLENGDSLTGGSSSSLPAYDSALYRHSLAYGVWPWLLAEHGSNMSQWANSSNWKFAKFSGLTAPNAVLASLGSNDIFGTSQVDFATYQTRFAATLATLRTVYGQGVPVYVGNVTPRTGSTTGNEAVRTSVNAWLLTLPGGIRNVFDYAAAVADPTTPAALNSTFNAGDNTHLNTAGYAAKARAIRGPLAIVNTK